MCGHIGIFKGGKANITRDHLDFFSEGLIVDMLRGTHGTGLARVTCSGQVSTLKGPVRGIDFVDSNRYDDLTLPVTDIRALIGHNRLATQGAHTYGNTHPFMHNHITLAHNGTIRNKEALVKNSKQESFGTDSETIAYAFAHYGVEETLAKINGAFALVWYNRKDETINFVRNNERTFYFTINEDNSVAYASEVGLLQWVLDRNKIKYKTVYELPTHNIITFDTSKKIEGYKKKEVKFYTYQYTHNGSHHQTHTKQDNSKKGKRNSKKSNTEYTGTPINLHNVDEELPQERTLSKRKEKRKALAHLGLKFDQTIRIVSWEFDEYTRRTGYGNLTATMTSAPWLNVKAFQVPKEIYERSGYYSARIRSIQIDTKCSSYSTLIVDNVQPLSTDDVEKEREARKKTMEAKRNVKKKQDEIGRERSENKIESDFLKGVEKDIGGRGAEAPVPFLETNSVLPDSDPDDEDYSELFMTGPRGILIPLHEWSRLTKDGCANCSCDLLPKDQEYIAWVYGDRPVCVECLDELTAPYNTYPDPGKLLN